MKLSTKSRYGARILIELSRSLDSGPIQVSQISKNQGIPIKYAEQIIRSLKLSGYIRSVRGPKGGHVLTRSPQKITLGEIVRLFEGRSELVDCISAPEKCDRSDECKIRLAWKKATDSLYKELDHITIQDLVT